MSLQNILVPNPLNLFCKTLNGFSVGAQGQFIGPQGLPGPNIFNQSLNTTNAVTFSNVNVTSASNSGFVTGDSTFATADGSFAYFNNTLIGDTVVANTGTNKVCIGNSGGVAVNSQLQITSNLVKVNAFLQGYYTTPTGIVGATTVVGTGATVTATGSQLGGTITLTTGTGTPTTVGLMATITFSTVPTPISNFGVILSPANSFAANSTLEFYSTATSTTTFTISNTAVLAASTVYVWNWSIAM
jgi:hypothetical protein